MRKNTESVFWERIDVLGEDDCWIWRGGVNDRNGFKYGIFKLNGKEMRVHRFAYYLSKKLPVEKASVVLHKCNNTLCCNPKHLYLARLADEDRIVRRRASIYKYRINHYDKYLEMQREYHRNHRKEETERMRIYRDNNREKIRSLSKVTRDKLIAETIKAYGGKCACCGETNPIFLTLDHKNNDGSKRRSNSKDVYAEHRRARNEGYPDDLEILCYNCNCGRARNGGICPHKESRNG